MGRFSFQWIAMVSTCAWLTTLGLAQDRALALTDRRPQFLLADRASKRPVAVDVREVPVLRKRISVNFDGITLKDALREISRRARLPFLFGEDYIPLDLSVRLRADNITVAGALSEVLVDANVDVLLSADGRAALIKRSVLPRHAAPVRGRVTAKESGKPIAGAEVRLALPDTSLRVVTGDSGAFTFADVPAGGHTISVRFVGYQPVSTRIVVDSVLVVVNFALESRAVALDELVATATGPQRRRDIGNAITTINADSVLRSAPIRNLTDLLANRVPGLSVQHTSGAPGDPARLRLRGISSVMRGNDPVVIVDGIRVYATQSEARSGNLTNMCAAKLGGRCVSSGTVPAPSPLDQIDPNSIEKVEVFKGPSAATLYGADAANGVIVVTTKKGKAGPTRWDARIEHGRTTPAGSYPTGYYRFGHLPENGEVHFCPLAYLRCVQDSVVRYQALNDPEMTPFGRGQRAALSLTASGGSQTLTYSITGTYEDELGLLKLPAFEIERFRTKYNRPAPEWMRRPHRLTGWSVASNTVATLGSTADVTLLAALSRTEQQRSSLENQQTALAGTYVEKRLGLYSRALSLTANYMKTGVGLEDYYRRTAASAVAFRTGLTANWRPWSWFTATSQAGLDVMARDDESLLPTGLLSAADSGDLTRGAGRSLVSTFNLRGTVRKPLKWGFVFETDVGADVVGQSTNDLVSTAEGLTPGTSSLDNAKSFTATDSRVSTSVFGWYIEPKVTGRRLSLSTGLRLDGGSTYGTRLTRTSGGLLGGLLGLPKLNGSWVISEEPWFPFNSVVSSLRLRGAYGQAQVQPGALDRLRLYTRRLGALGDVLTLDKLGNTDLRPERSTEFEGGFDADLLDSRLSLELTLYRKLQVDALMQTNLPGSVYGGGSVTTNIGNIRNTGLDVTARVTPVQTSFLTWSAALIFNRNTNTLTKLGAGVEPNSEQGIVAGYPIGGRWSRPILGFADRNDNRVIEPGEVQIGDSLVYMGRLLPAYKASFSTNLALFGGAVGVVADFAYDAGATQIDETARTNWVLSRALVDPTTPLEQQAAAVVFDSTTYGLTQDVSTFRFNSLSVTYRAPEAVARLVRARRLSVAVQGSNLGLHSTYRGKDPDVSAWSPTEHVVDTGQIAQPRTWQLAVMLQF